MPRRIPEYSPKDLVHHNRQFLAAACRSAKQLADVSIFIAMGDIYRMQPYVDCDIPSEAIQYRAALGQEAFNSMLFDMPSHVLFSHPETAERPKDFTRTIPKRDKLESFLIGVSRSVRARRRSLADEVTGHDAFKSALDAFDFWFATSRGRFKLGFGDLVPALADRSPFAVDGDDPQWLKRLCTMPPRPVSPT